MFVKSTNRNLLRWLKLWDYSVFGIQTKAFIAKSMNAKTKKKETNFTSNKKQPEAVDADLLDENNLPCQKVISMCDDFFSFLKFLPFFQKSQLVTDVHVVSDNALFWVIVYVLEGSLFSKFLIATVRSTVC
jgi:hypothetical protein